MSKIGGGQFATTRWSVVLQAQTSDDSAGRQALEQLCESYWQPLYMFIRRRGYSSEAAADLTQGFFVHLLAKKILEKLAPERGKFRSFLMVCVKNFLANEHDMASAQKRGGGLVHLSLDLAEAESKYALLSNEPSPETAFDKEWASLLLHRVHLKLDASVPSGRKAFHDAIKQFLTIDPADTTYADLAEQFATTPVAIRVAVCRLRNRFRKLLRQEVSETLESDEEIETEIGHLLRVLSH